MNPIKAIVQEPYEAPAIQDITPVSVVRGDDSQSIGVDGDDEFDIGAD